MHVPAFVLFCFVKEKKKKKKPSTFTKKKKKEWIQSKEGVRQGDRLGPFFFVIGLQAVLQALARNPVRAAAALEVAAGSPVEIVAAVLASSE